MLLPTPLCLVERDDTWGDRMIGAVSVAVSQVTRGEAVALSVE